MTSDFLIKSAHPHDLATKLVKVKLVPTPNNTTSKLQPMGQGVIKKFIIDK